jgi:hypothetical protein
MWKLLFFFMINGQPHLGLLDVAGPTECKQKATELLAAAEKKDIPLILRCVEIKLA